MLTKYIVLVAKTGEAPRVWNEFNTRREADRSARDRHLDGISEWDYVAVFERRSQWRAQEEKTPPAPSNGVADQVGDETTGGAA